MKAIIHTTQNRKGTWDCHGTINGFDYSFNGTWADAAKLLMIYKIKEIEARNKCKIEVKWNAPITYSDACKKEADVKSLIASTTRLDRKQFD